MNGATPTGDAEPASAGIGMRTPRPAGMAASRPSDGARADWPRRAGWLAAAVAIAALGGGIGYRLAELAAPATTDADIAAGDVRTGVNGHGVIVSIPEPAPVATANRTDSIPDSSAIEESASPMTDAPEVLTPPPSGDAVEDRTPPPAWKRNAAPAVVLEGQPMIAVVVDDMGVALARSWQAIDLPAPLTLAYLPYAEDLAAQTEAARRAGHELIVHLPMEPENGEEDPGPNALLTGLDEGELRQRLDWNLERFGGYVGASNHMGSRYTRDAAAMELVLSEVRSRGLLFLDSRTTPDSVALRLARDAGVPATRRDVFIDNVADAEAIDAQLAALEDMATEHGYAVGIGHPRPKTLRALAKWLPGVRDRGFALVPISAIVARTERIDLTADSGVETGVTE